MKGALGDGPHWAFLSLSERLLVGVGTVCRKKKKGGLYG
nr:MAG TPA: hypothetical protein [Caudoviricetes sp.]